MESTDLWERFLRSGRVADYLAYRQSLQAELGQELHPLTQPLPERQAKQTEHGTMQDR